VLVPIKFIGGVLAIGAGLALGREGPSVQMGASLAHLLGIAFRRSWPDCRVLLAAGAGAGLATAFNAPIAGAVFVLEELVRKFEPRIAIAALGASSTAITISRAILGDMPDFQTEALTAASVETRPLFFVFGVLAGLAAIFYNRSLLWTMAAVARLSVASLKPGPLSLGVTIAAIVWFDPSLGLCAGILALAYVQALSLEQSRAGLFARAPVELRASLIGAGVAITAWIAPALVGGGDGLTQQAIFGRDALALLPFLFFFRLGLGAFSYAAGTPGGLFAPMLVLGAQLGLFFGDLCRLALPSFEIQPEGFAIVGMAAFFAGVVRAPLTGIVLVTEMTSSVTMLLPMLGACFVAMLVPTMSGDAPLYDSLRELTLQRDRAAKLRGN
jgi:CIC family chloride channel protein